MDVEKKADTVWRRAVSRGRRIGLADIMPIIGCLIGLAILVYPVIVDVMTTEEASLKISTMSGTVDDTNDPRRLENLAQAQRYNARLAKDLEYSVDNEGMGGLNGGEEDIVTVEPVEGDPLPYDEQLCWRGVPALSWLEIPAIATKLPIYHGTSDETLAAGVGHLDSTSLPIGGLSSHCVLSAHSGLKTTMMFDNIDKLAPGDVFIVHTLNDCYAYEVVESIKVLPEDVPEHIRIRKGQDLCTLMTCTPYGVNTHRLLVFGSRVPFDGKIDVTPPVTAYVNNRTVPLAICILAVAIALVIFTAALVRHQDKKPSHEGMHVGPKTGTMTR